MINIILIFVFLVAGCATNHKGEATEEKYRVMLNTWIGAPVDAMSKSWGYPDSQFQAPNGNKVYVYGRSMSETTPITSHKRRYNYGRGTTTDLGGETITYWCKTFFEVGPDEKIIRWSLKGNLCV